MSSRLSNLDLDSTRLLTVTGTMSAASGAAITVTVDAATGHGCPVNSDECILVRVTPVHAGIGGGAITFAATTGTRRSQTQVVGGGATTDVYELELTPDGATAGRVVFTMTRGVVGATTRMTIRCGNAQYSTTVAWTP